MEWQTWRSQKPLLERACGFESRSRHSMLCLSLAISRADGGALRTCQTLCAAIALLASDNAPPHESWAHIITPSRAEPEIVDVLTGLAGDRRQVRAATLLSVAVNADISEGEPPGSASRWIGQ